MYHGQPLDRGTSSTQHTEMLAFSRNAWLPDLQTSFVRLATAIRAEDVPQIRFFTHRIRGCAAMGGVEAIVASMNDVREFAVSGRWLSVRSRFRDANYVLTNITEWVAHESGNLAS